MAPNPLRKKAKDSFPQKSIDLVLGGFHLLHYFKDDVSGVIEGFHALDVARVGPVHCTGGFAQSLFKESYQENYLDLKSGSMIEI